MVKGMNDRLTKSDWIDHGLRTLAAEGANALKVGAMAAKLNVSRGSFYWHFRDIADFRSHLLRSWLEQTTERVIRRIETEETGPDRLKSLLRGAFVMSPGAERWAAEDAIRAWAADDADVAAMVASVDERRIAYIAELLISAGVENTKAPARAAFLYWAYLGRGMAMASGHSTMTTSAADDISALFET